jgi:hypothetical protein
MCCPISTSLAREVASMLLFLPLHIPFIRVAAILAVVNVIDSDNVGKVSKL